jgi:hypothetical protein
LFTSGSYTSSGGPNKLSCLYTQTQLLPLPILPIYIAIMNPSSPSERSARDFPSSNPPATASSTLSHRPAVGRSQSSESPSPQPGNAPIPDDEHGADLPMNMTASVMLTGLPRDAHLALADVEAIDTGKGKHQPKLFVPLTTQTNNIIPRQSPSASSHSHQPRFLRIGSSKSAPLKNLRR